MCNVVTLIILLVQWTMGKDPLIINRHMWSDINFLPWFFFPSSCAGLSVKWVNEWISIYHFNQFVKLYLEHHFYRRLGIDHRPHVFVVIGEQECVKFVFGWAVCWRFDVNNWKRKDLLDQLDPVSVGLCRRTNSTLFYQLIRFDANVSTILFSNS